jgi:hypothetical protein
MEGWSNSKGCNEEIILEILRLQPLKTQELMGASGSHL